MKWLGIDFGRRRVGLALSDSSATLARPWKTIAAGRTADGTIEAILAEAERLRRETWDDSGIDGFVVGLPRRLGGEDNEQTADVRKLAARLGERTGLPVHLQDERLSSREAEAHLAGRERDWRKRKPLIDAMAAAIFLQDFLDEAARSSSRSPVDE